MQFSKISGCVIRLGDQYFFNVSEPLFDSLSYTTLQQIESVVSSAGPDNEPVRKFKKIKRNFSLLKIPQNLNKLPTQTLKLQSLQDVKKPNISRKRKHDDSEQSFVSANNRRDNLRPTFFSSTKLSQTNFITFAKQNGFLVTVPQPLKVFINVEINNLEITIIANNFGVVEDVQHRKVCWLSTTFKRFKKNETEDVHCCFEVEEEHDRDENCLSSLKKYLFLNNRSIFNSHFVKLINQVMINVEILPSNPLLPDLNWKLQDMRVTRCVSRYENNLGDVLEFNEVFDGTFDSNYSFDWFEKRHEIEININPNQRNIELLCHSSYEMSLRLFNFSKMHI